MRSPRIRLTSAVAVLPMPAGRFARGAAAALRRVTRRPVTVSLVVLDDTAIRRLNRRFLGHACATDVIAFNLQPGARPAGPGAPWGEVYVSATTACREAKVRGIAPGEELLRYAIHGMLHLFGYDDHRPADRRRMWSRQEALVRYAQATEGRRSRSGKRKPRRDADGRR